MKRNKMLSAVKVRIEQALSRLIRIGDMRLFRVLILALSVLCFTCPARAEVSVQAAVDQQEVFVGETFTLQVQVEGEDSPPEPDVSVITDFQVEARGGQQNSSESVSIVNGRMSRVSHSGYVFNYGLTPKREGRLIIPALTLRIGKQEYQTQAVTILVKKPIETSDLKLRQSLDKSRVYAGEPLTLTVTWYIGKDVNGFNFNLPILDDPRFSISDSDGAALNPKQDNVVRIPVAGGEILAEKANGVLDGQNFLTVSFRKTLVAKQAGVLTLPQATVSCQALSGQRQAARDPFSGMFPDDIFGRSRQVFHTEVVPSNEPTLEVLPLPEEGKPADFSGLVGAYSLAVTAMPTKVKVGDPITLTIQIAGPAAVSASLPSLAEALGQDDFKVPSDIAPGEGSTVLKTFTQTVRARHAGVRQVPALHLSYFNPATGRYETAASQAVALEVADAKIVTAQDAEGAASGAAAMKQELKAAKGGISYNYEGPELLVNQTPSGMINLHGVWYALLALPPGLFLLIFLGTLVVRHGRNDPAGRAARQANRRLQATLDGLAVDAVSASGYQRMGIAIREYLGAKLRRNPASLTYADVEQQLLMIDVGGECLTSLRQIMEQCAAYEYAGPSAGTEDLLRLRDWLRQVVAELEQAHWPVA
ncbi:MAG: BatD family protein [Desulfobulbaceae bacterium]|nr:BatD family protein [Desulfobulbaceae bacterium]